MRSTKCRSMQKMDDNKSKFGDSRKCDIFFNCQSDDDFESNCTPSVITSKSSNNECSNLHFLLNYKNGDRAEKKFHRTKRIKLRPQNIENFPHIEQQILESTRKYYIDVNIISKHLHSLPNGPHHDKESSRDYFYCNILSRCAPQCNLDQGCFEMTFRNFYNMIRSTISKLSKKNRRFVSTLSGFEGRYTFDKVSMLEVHDFLVNYDESGSSLESSESDEDTDDIQHVYIDGDSDSESDVSMDDDNDDIFCGYEDETLLELQNDLKNVQKNCVFSKTELAMMDLHQLLISSGAPMYLFDELMNWMVKNAKTFRIDEQPPKRKTFIQNISKKVYGHEMMQKLRPEKVKVTLNNNEQISVTQFDFEAMIITLLNDHTLMHYKNLLLDCNDPHKLPPENIPLGDLNTGNWHRETHSEICKEKNEVLLPIILFIDAGRVTGRTSVEPVTFTLGIFKREVRYLDKAWRNFGYIENQNNITRKCKRRVKRKKTTIKLENYHIILDQLFKSLKELQGKNGGFMWNLKLKDKTFRVKFKIATQVILGDCQGLDKLCGHFGGSHPRMKVLCRDCNVPPSLSDNPRHQCVFIKKEDLENKTKAQLKLLSKHPIKNAMFRLYFGAKKRSIFNCSPPEPLHQYLYGIVKYLVIDFIADCPSTTIKLINSTVERLFKNFSKQSDRHYPDFSSVQNGITFCDTLSAMEQYGRLFAIFLALSMPEVFMSLANDDRKSVIKDPKTKKNKFIKKKPMGEGKAKEWKDLIELTLVMYQCIMKDEHHKEFLEPEDGNINVCGFQEMIRDFMEEYANLVKRESKYGLKIKKFHSILHYANHIRDSGSVKNVDTGRCESIAVSMYKRPSKLTQRRQISLNEQLSQRFVEGMVMDEARRLFTKKCGDFKFTKEQLDVNVSKKNCLSGSKYHINFSRHHRERKVEFNIHWDAKHCKHKFDKPLTEFVARRLFTHWGHGGCISEESVVTCHTEYVDEEGAIYRAHPDYKGEGKCWYDWCNIEWEKDSIQPAKLLCFIDLRKVVFLNSDEQHELRSWMETNNKEDMVRMLASNAKNFKRQEFLNNDIFAVICSGLTEAEENDKRKGTRTKNSEVVPSWYTKYTKLSQIIPQKIMLEDSFRLVSVSNIAGPIYCIPTTMRNIPVRRSFFFQLLPMSEWANVYIDGYIEHFLNTNGEERKLKNQNEDDDDEIENRISDNEKENDKEIDEIEISSKNSNEDESIATSSEGTYGRSSEEDSQFDWSEEEESDEESDEESNEESDEESDDDDPQEC